MKTKNEWSVQIGDELRIDNISEATAWKMLLRNYSYQSSEILYRDMIMARRPAALASHRDSPSGG